MQPFRVFSFNFKAANMKKLRKTFNGFLTSLDSKIAKPKPNKKTTAVVGVS